MGTYYTRLDRPILGHVNDEFERERDQMEAIVAKLGGDLASHAVTGDIASATGIVLADSTAGNITLTLPTLAAADAGKKIILKKIVSANDVVLVGTIDGVSGLTIAAAALKRSITLLWSGTAWYIIGSHDAA